MFILYSGIWNDAYLYSGIWNYVNDMIGQEMQSLKRVVGKPESGNIQENKKEQIYWLLK